MSRHTIITSGLLLFALTGSALACLWDSDTLQMERQRFPGVLEIITGKFVRHSRAYYEWRIGDRKKKLETTPDDPALIDDLAVAYAKMGRPEEGIPLLEKALETHPDRYETISNLGTLLFFAGRLDESKDHIRRALEINPNAHFGREKYQLLLTEYLQQSSHDTEGVMSLDERFHLEGAVGFTKYVLTARNLPPEQYSFERSPKQLAEVRAATRGVLGMMHFADFQSPILLEALGDLLIDGLMEENAGQLAARAYLRAARLADDSKASAHFKRMSDHALGASIDYAHDKEGERKLDLELDQEVANAALWFAEIEADEKQWIAENRNVDLEFARKYYDSLERTISAAEKQLRSEPKETRLTMRQKGHRLLLAAGAVCIGTPVTLLCLTVGGIIWWRRRSWQTAKP
jgi:tetratricopeptide (TPR) repeat protein